jgi:hypothetical protein
MSPPLDCGCALCILEPRLLSALATTNADMIRELIPDSSRRNEICCAADLVSHLKTLSANTESDAFLGELLTARPLDPNFVDSVPILAFLPILHLAVRRVARQQPCLPTEDITQQTLSILLQYLRSAELHARQSHFAFAISRAVKRKIFEWAQRESRRNGTAHSDPAFLDALVEDDSFERHLLLRHFPHRCVTKRLITDSELNWLIDFKLEGAPSTWIWDRMEIRPTPSGRNSNASSGNCAGSQARDNTPFEDPDRASARTPSRQAPSGLSRLLPPASSRDLKASLPVLSVTRSDLVPACG